MTRKAPLQTLRFSRHQRIIHFLLLVPGIALMIFTPRTAHAQSDWLRWFGPDIGGLKPAIGYKATVYGDNDVSDQHRDFRLTEHSGTVFSPIRQDDRSEWSAAASVRAHDVKTDAVLPTTGEAFPGTLWDMRAGTLYRQKLDNGWIGGGSVSVGSASDKPFSGSKETELQATVFTRIPDGDKNAWLLLLTYSNNREFMNNIPWPSLGYWFEPNDRYRLVLGIPFAMLEVKPANGLTLDFFYLPVRTVHAGVSYRIAGPVKIYTAFDWRHESWFRRDRTDDDYRLFYYEKRGTAGIQWDLFRGMTLDLSGGYSFDRFYFEGKDYGDRARNRLDVNDGAFAAVSASYRF